MVFNADLISDMARQRVVLFLGAGVSASAVTEDGNSIKGWDSFLKSAAQEADKSIKDQVNNLLEQKDYLLSCEILQSHFGQRWEDIVGAEFNKIASPSEVHKKILGLNQKIIVTTNFDKLLESACASSSNKATHYPKVLAKMDDKVFRVLKDNDNYYIIKIHGSVDNPEEIVFSRSQYIKNAFGNAHYSSFLESLLLNYTLLFIGFSMSDPAITSLMEMYALRYPSARPHYILSGDDYPDNILETNKRLRKLSVISYDKSNGHAQLPIVLEDMIKQSIQKKKEMFSSMVVDF